MATRDNRETDGDQAGPDRPMTNHEMERGPGMFARRPVGRCPSCGGRVYLPCLACKVRKQLVGGKLKPAETE